MTFLQYSRVVNYIIYLLMLASSEARPPLPTPPLLDPGVGGLLRVSLTFLQYSRVVNYILTDVS